MKDINEQDILGKTALMRASFDSDIKKVKELLNDDNIDVNFQDKDGWTALITAAYHGHLEVVKELLKNKTVDISLQDNWGKTALQWVTEENQEIARLLGVWTWSKEDLINKRKTKK